MAATAAFLYTGTYQQNGNAMTARVHIKRYAQGAANVMGRDQFDLEMTGTLQGNTIRGAGKIPGTQLQLSGTLTKHGDLPARVAA